MLEKHPNAGQDSLRRRGPRAGEEERMRQSLVLNATYEPLGVVSDRRALILVLNNRAITVQESEHALKHPGGEVVLPAVIRLTKYIRVPYRHAVPLTRRAIFARDGGRCVYCDAPATSIDHVMPRSRGGSHAWENVVSACHRCNHVKADRMLKDLGWRMRNKPIEPAGAAWRILGSGRAEPTWVQYLEPYGASSAIA